VFLFIGFWKCSRFEQFSGVKDNAFGRISIEQA